MFNRRTFVIVKRELQTRLFSKSFIIMTLLVPVFLIGIMAFQTFVFTYDSDEGTRIRVVAETFPFQAALRKSFAKLEVVKSGYYKVDFDTLGAQSPKQYAHTYRKDLLSGKLTGIYVLQTSALKNKKVSYFSANPNNNTVFSKTRNAINEVLVDEFFKNRVLLPEERDFVRAGIDIEGSRVTEDGQIEEESVGNIVLSFMFTFFLYFSLLLIGTSLMRAVVEEKANKIIEVLLSSVNARELMTGKIIGSAVTGVMQMAIWLSPVVLLVTTNIFTLPKELALKVELSMIAYFLFNYFLALVTFLGLFAAVGAMFDNDQDTQSGVWPITLLIMIPFFVAMGIAQKGDNDLSRVTSMLPFAALIVMPARTAMASVPFWQFALSFVVNIATMLLVFPLAGKIYRVGILMTGKKPTWKDVAKWLKYKY